MESELCLISVHGCIHLRNWNASDTPEREEGYIYKKKKKKKKHWTARTRSHIWTFVSAAQVCLKLSFAGHAILQERGRKKERDEKKTTTLEHSENEEKPWRQMAESISPIRRSYFICHARVCEAAVSITEQAGGWAASLLGPGDRSRGAFGSEQQESTIWSANETKMRGLVWKKERITKSTPLLLSSSWTCGLIYRRV